VSSRTLHVLHLLAEDPVIFHLFALELKAVWDRMQAEPQRRWAALLPRAFAGSWRHRALEALLPVFTDPQQLPADHQLLAFGPDQLDPLDATRWLVNPHTFCHYAPSAAYRAMAAQILRYHGLQPQQPREVVLIQRRGSRLLQAAETGEALEIWLSPRLNAAGIPWHCLILEDLDPIEQWRSLLAARLLIGAHGSGLTNLVFTPDGCGVLEIDLRRHFTCDPLCEAHRQGWLAPGEPCSTHSPAYHKADYHNLAGVFGRSYQSLSAEAVHGYRSANPIDVSMLRVSGESVLAQIRASFQVMPPVSKSVPLRLAVLSSFYGRPAWSRDSLANHLAYCLRHGYDYLPALHRQRPELHHSWERVERLRQLLRGGRYDAVFWMDGDSWFLDAAFPLERLLHDSEASIQFTGDQSDLINTGHLLFRCDAPALAFLDAWWAMRRPTDVQLPTSHYHQGGLMDGPAAIALLGGADPHQPGTWPAGFNAINGCPGNPAGAQAEIAEPWQSHCKVWPQGRLNAYPWAMQPGDFILHFVGDQAKQWMERSRHLVERYPGSSGERIV
jgi:hypothetical protein